MSNINAGWTSFADHPQTSRPFNLRYPGHIPSAHNTSANGHPSYDRSRGAIAASLECRGYQRKSFIALRNFSFVAARGRVPCMTSVIATYEAPALEKQRKRKKSEKLESVEKEQDDGARGGRGERNIRDSGSVSAFFSSPRRWTNYRRLWEASKTSMALEWPRYCWPTEPTDADLSAIHRPPGRPEALPSVFPRTPSQLLSCTFVWAI